MPHTILLVDDDDVIRGLMRAYLERGGYQVIDASNGPDAIEQYTDAPPDLMVLDIAMPGMSGFEVAKRIRDVQQAQGRAHMPIIILTAYARSFFLSDSGEAGVDSYLTKPITPEQLLNHIQQFLGSPS